MEIRNIFDNLPTVLAEEVFETIAAQTNIRIERIVSSGQVTPEGCWYDQEETEWVILLQGTADILFENELVPRRLRRGDYLLIPPHCKHRVLYTSHSPIAIWIAIFF